MIGRILAVAFLAGVIYGVPIALLAQHAWANVFCWLRRRRVQRQLDADRERRLARVMAAVREPAPPPEPLVKEVSDWNELYMVARKTVCNLRAQDRRRWFPGDPTGGVN